MKLSLVLSTPALLVLAHPSTVYHTRDGSVSLDDWAPPGDDDFRGPCPMMNTLANHGFLPHDGKALTEPVVVQALADGLNFDSALAELMFRMALVANPEPNATFFTLDMLNVHGVLEHDASLSREDAQFGDQQAFSPTVFAQTLSYWSGATILTPTILAMSKLGRQAFSKATNPAYAFTANTENFSLGEVAAPIIAFGNMTDGTVRKDLVEFFFRNERLPAELGWTKKEAVVTQDDILSVVGLIDGASGLITEETTAARLRARGGFHFGGSL